MLNLAFILYSEDEKSKYFQNGVAELNKLLRTPRSIKYVAEFDRTLHKISVCLIVNCIYVSCYVKHCIIKKKLLRKSYYNLQESDTS